MTWNISVWNITMFFVHLGALGGAIFLYRDAPCWMQRVTLVGFCIAMVFCAGAFAAALSGLEHYRWPIFLVGLLFEHLAVLLYLFRLIYRDHLQWKSSSAPSPH